MFVLLANTSTCGIWRRRSIADDQWHHYTNSASRSFRAILPVWWQ